MGIDGWAYKVAFLVHILSAIVGFGGPVLGAVYAGQGRAKGGAEAAAVAEVNLHVTERWNRPFIYLVALSGIALVAFSDGVWGAFELWVVLAVVLYVVALGISHGALTPAARRMTVLVREAAGHSGEGPPPGAPEMGRLGGQLRTLGMALNLILVVILVLMIWKPGA